MLEATGNNWRVDHHGFYQAYFEDSICEIHSAQALIGHLVVTETDGSYMRYLVAPTADERFSLLRCGGLLERLQRDFAHKHPASHLDGLAMIENGFALEASDPTASLSDYQRAPRRTGRCDQCPNSYENGHNGNSVVIFSCDAIGTVGRCRYDIATTTHVPLNLRSRNSTPAAEGKGSR